jgi:hypothetical protein
LSGGGIPSGAVSDTMRPPQQGWSNHRDRSATAIERVAAGAVINCIGPVRQHVEQALALGAFGKASADTGYAFVAENLGYLDPAASPGSLDVVGSVVETRA